MRPDTSQKEPILPPDLLDAARMEARARGRPLPGWLARALIIAVLAGLAGFAYLSGRELNHIGGPGTAAGFIVVAIATLGAMGGLYVLFDLIRTVGAMGGKAASAHPAEDEILDLTIEQRVVYQPAARQPVARRRYAEKHVAPPPIFEQAEEPRGVSVLTLLLVIAGLWLAYLLLKPLLFS